MRFHTVLLLVLLTIVSCSSVATADDAIELLDQGIAHYRLREDPEQIVKAIEMFEQTLEAAPDNYEAAWRLSRAFWYYGNFNEPSSKKIFFQKGIEAGRRAIELDGTDCKGHFWLGVNYALLAENSGVFEAYGLIDQVKEQMNRAMDVDELCECGGPQRVLGKLYSKIPFFKGGSKEKAIASLTESLKICPQDTQSRIFLAEVYLDEGKKGLAIQQLKLVLKQEPDPDWLPETRVNKQLAERMLSELNHKKK